MDTKVWCPECHAGPFFRKASSRACRMAAWCELCAHPACADTSHYPHTVPFPLCHLHFHLAHPELLEAGERDPELGAPGGQGSGVALSCCRLCLLPLWTDLGSSSWGPVRPVTDTRCDFIGATKHDALSPQKTWQLGRAHSFLPLFPLCPSPAPSQDIARRGIGVSMLALVESAPQPRKT